jgi:hypothetical protein
MDIPDFNISEINLLELKKIIYIYWMLIQLTF